MRPTVPAASIRAVLFLAAVSSSCPVRAASADDAVDELDAVVVTATRTPRRAEDVPQTVDVITRDTMERRQMQDWKDLFRYEPGVSVGANADRFGIGDIRVRGLGGNRVRIQVDGVPVPDAFAIGSYSSAGRAMVDPAVLKQVDVVRGPGSALYGSDALGGMVQFITRDPRDYLDADRNSHVGFRIGYAGHWQGLHAAATGAFGSEHWAGLVNVSHHQGRETANQGTQGGIGATRTLPNPQHIDGRSLLAKLQDQAGDQHWLLTLEGSEQAVDTRVMSQEGLQRLTGAVHLRVEGADRQRRSRIGLKHAVDAMDWILADQLDWQLFHQDSATEQATVEERRLPAPTLRDVRTRAFTFDQTLDGMQLNARRALSGQHVRHDLAWGVEVTRIRTEQQRDGMRHFPLIGASTPVMLPDVFPVRDFPISTTTQAGVYLQDEMQWMDGRLRVVPALRVDYYRLRPRADAIFAEDNPGVAVVGLEDWHLSPKLGAVWALSDDVKLFGGWSHGYRAPPYSDVNIGFTNLQFGYTAIANPDLKPETSDGIEIGLRYAGDALQGRIALYHNRYRDFIESWRFVGFNADGLMLYQSQNVSRATISGAEAKADLQLGRLSTALDGWRLHGAAAWSRGDNDTEDLPLDGVDPLTAALGVAWDGHSWGIEVSGRAVQRKRRVSDPNLVHNSGYAVWDAYGWWQLADGLRLDLGVRNLADKRYREAGDLPLLLADSAALDRFTAPGRHLLTTLSVQW